MIRRNLPTLTALVVVVAAGLVHGYRTNRWGDSPALQYATESLPQLPETIGDWVGEDVKPSEEQIRTYIKAELRVAVVRTYTHRESGQRISIMAVCGPSGAIGTHTPEACYTGAGYLLAAQPQIIEFSSTTPGGKPNYFWSSDFRIGEQIAPSGLKIYWSYRPGAAGSHWAASEKPRGDFAAYSALYKLYVIREMPMAGASPVEDSVGPDFIRELLPAIESTVFASIDDQAPASSLLR